jgi:hypothetical protein
MRAGQTAGPHEIVAALQRDGYRAEFRVDGDGALCCPVCGTCQTPARATLDRVQPSGATLLLAVRCPACGERGSAVVASGPGAPRGDLALHGTLTALSAVRASP